MREEQVAVIRRARRGPVHCGVGRLLEEQISDKISHRILDQGMIVWWSIEAGCRAAQSPK
jgi:hypothetical protein